MIIVRKSEERGKADFGWLDSKHTFSFGNYYDANHMGFGPLRVINEDKVKPAAGFDTHGHRDMEIISYVLDGALEHKDNIGNGSVIKPGDIQRMTAGTGVLHSEYNHSKDKPVHFLQIWIEPNQQGLEPGYEQKYFDQDELSNELKLVGSQDGRDGSLVIHQDVNLYVGKLEEGQQILHDISPTRGLWVQVAKGEVMLDEQKLEAGDGASITDLALIKIGAIENSEILLFDLAL